MTWQNLPCAPTLPALFAACPHGWAEIEFTYHAGNPTSDPPQDADCSIGFGRVWGIDHEDLRGGPCRPPVLDHDVLLDLREPPLGVPHRDFVLLARVVHRAGPCNMCGRQRRADEEAWSCFSGTWTEGDDDDLLSPSCPGAFPFEAVLETCWGDHGKPVVFVGAAPVYGVTASTRRSWTTPTIVLSDAAAAAMEPRLRVERRENLIVTSTALSHLKRDLRRIDTPSEDEVMRTLEEAHSAVEEQIRVLRVKG